MTTSSFFKVQSYSLEAETLLISIRHARPDLDLEPIKAWANSQAMTSLDHDALHYLGEASRAVMRSDPLPWLQDPPRDPETFEGAMAQVRQAVTQVKQAMVAAFVRNER